MMAHTPLSVAATRMEPSEHSPTAKRMTAPRPPFLKALGVMPRTLAGAGIEAAVGIVAGLVERLRDGVGLGELVPDPAGAMCIRVGLRGEPGGRLEDAVEVVAAHVGRLGQLVEARQLVRCLDHAGRPPPRERLAARTPRPRWAGSACRAENRPSRPRLRSCESGRSRAAAGGPSRTGGNRCRCSARHSRSCRRRPCRDAGPHPNAPRRGGYRP